MRLGGVTLPAWARRKNTVFDKKTLQCGPDVHILIEPSLSRLR
jgi:hypothetical protein